MPTLFISHGAPTLALEKDNPTADFLRGIAANLAKPKAIVVASAHWETESPMVNGAGRPRTIHDFRGFPKELYQIYYDAPGNPKLAGMVKNLLGDAGLNAGIDPGRGFDHGVWSPLMLIYPKADIPIVEISIQPQQDARWHYKIGEALAPLRQENILIIGTGNLTHNLREAMSGNHAKAPAWVTDFSEWIATKVAEGDTESLIEWQKLAPHARENHPTPDHFLPFFVSLGAAAKPLKAKRLHNEVAMGVLAMDAYEFE